MDRICLIILENLYLSTLSTAPTTTVRKLRRIEEEEEEALVRVLDPRKEACHRLSMNVAELIWRLEPYVDRLGRLPTQRELDEPGGYELWNEIKKVDVALAMSSRFRVRPPSNTVASGRIVEYYVEKFLHDRGLRASLCAPGYPYDILVEGKVRVEVKSRHADHVDSDLFAFSWSAHSRGEHDIVVLCPLSKGDAVIGFLVVSQRKHPKRLTQRVRLSSDVWRMNMNNISEIVIECGGRDQLSCIIT